MRTLKSIVAAVMTAVMIACLSVSAFAIYDDKTYDDVSEMYGTTLDVSKTLYLKFVDSLGIIPGMNNGSYSPSINLSRGDALKIAYRMLHYDYDELKNYQSVNTDFDEDKGGDISDVDLLKPYIAWAMDYGLVNSVYVPENQFKSEQDITGAEFITLIAKTVGIATGDQIIDDTAQDVYDEFLEVILMDSNVDASSQTVNREQAAVIVAGAMLYDKSVNSISEDMFSSFSDFNGTRLNCLATNIYGCNATELVVRATKQSPMGYDSVIKDMLLSNGVQVDTGMDMSEFIGYPVNVIYLDKDDSNTFTQDEEMITYEMVSPWVNTVSLSDIKVASYSAINGSTTQSSFSIYSNTLLYLNGNLWPDDENYKLTKLVNFVDFTTQSAVNARPNLEFTFIQSGSAENADLVLATEWIPGRIMTVTNNYYAVYSYYDDQVRVYDDNDIVFTNTVNLKSGDFVNFYESGNKLHIAAGTTVTLSEYGNVLVGDTTCLSGKAAGEEEATVYQPHLFCAKNLRPLSSLSGPITVVLDSTRTTYIALEEARETKEIAVQILDATANSDGTTAEVQVRELASAAEYTMTVDIDRISSGTGKMDSGDYFTYYKTQNGKINMFGVDPVQMNVIETADYFITAGGQKYLKTESFISDNKDQFYSGNVTLLVDHYDGVWAVYGA